MCMYNSRILGCEVENFILILDPQDRFIGVAMDSMHLVIGSKYHYKQHTINEHAV